MARKEKCTRCSKPASPRYAPMESWNLSSPLCGACYSYLIGEHYEGEHTRIS